MSEVTPLVFEYEILIRESLMDTFGHMNNSKYLELFEEARWEIIDPRGFGLKAIRERGIGPVVLEVNLRFAREIRLREKIKIRSTIAIEPGSNPKTNKTMRMQQTMVNEKGEVCCTANFTFRLFDMKSRKLIAPTLEWLHAVGIG